MLCNPWPKRVLLSLMNRTDRSLALISLRNSKVGPLHFITWKRYLPSSNTFYIFERQQSSLIFVSSLHCRHSNFLGRSQLPPLSRLDSRSRLVQNDFGIGTPLQRLRISQCCRGMVRFSGPTTRFWLKNTWITLMFNIEIPALQSRQGPDNICEDYSLKFWGRCLSRRKLYV